MFRKTVSSIIDLAFINYRPAAKQPQAKFAQFCAVRYCIDFGVPDIFLGYESWELPYLVSTLSLCYINVLYRQLNLTVSLSF